jgi:hypothetical protein
MVVGQCPNCGCSAKGKNTQKLISSVILYGCKTWALTLREEHRLRVSETRVLRGIFGSKRDEVMGGS